MKEKATTEKFSAIKEDKCKTFYTYDNHIGEPRFCINCGKSERLHKL